MLHRGENSQRLLTTVLFTDIVGSTERAAALGDRRWKDLVARHHAIVRRELRRFHGRELDTAGDGFFASFDRPAQAIECATAVIDDLRPLDLQIRAAIHMGEVEVMGDKVGGITVHVASRALALAAPGEILVTRTVREVAAGADVTFSDRGIHEFKGVPEEWDIYAVEWQRRAVPVAATTGQGAEPAARRRPRWRTVVGAAVLGGALTAVAASALLAPGTGTPPPVPQPDSAVSIDPATGGVAVVVPAGDTPTGITIADDTAWVLSQGDKVLTGIPVAGGSPRTVGLSGPPTGIAAGDGSVWITFGYGATDQGSGMVLWLSAANPKQSDRIPTGNGVNAIALGEGGVWVTNGVANTLTKIDPVTRSEVKTVAVGDKPVAVAVGEGSVWVANDLSRTIWRLDTATLGKGSEISLRDSPTAIALGFGRLWVTSSVGGTVVVIDVSTNGLVETIPLGLEPRGIAAGPDAVWVACGRGALVRIDPVSRTTSRMIELPGPAEGVAVSGTDVWVTVQR